MSVMQLADYLAADRGRAVRLAKACNSTSSFISQMAAKRRPVPAERCAQIEAATGHVVRRWDLRPMDWHRIWPELVGVEGAPAVLQDIADSANTPKEQRHAA